MPKLTAAQWEDVRAEREAGASFPALASAHGISHQAIQARAKKEGWGDGTDAAAAVRAKVAEKVAGVIASYNPKKKAEAIDAAADRAAEVIRRHQEETNAIRDRLYSGLKLHKAAENKEQKQLAFEDLKAAKIASEALQNIHRLERQAWNIDSAPAGPTITIERRY